MLYKESNDNILLCDECEDDYINRCKEIGGEYVDLSNSEPAPAYINVLYEYGNSLIISSKSHPVSLVQFEITERIKENTKVYFFTNEGADDYIKHCEDLSGEYKNLSSNNVTSFNSQYTILEITENDCQQDDFSDKLYNALRCIWDDVKATSGKKVIYLNNIYIFFDEQYRTDKCVNLLMDIFEYSKQYDCLIVIFNWKPTDYEKRYFEADSHIDYIAKILSQMQIAIILAIDNVEDIKIVSDIFHLTEKEEKDILSLKENEGMRIYNNKYELIHW